MDYQNNQGFPEGQGQPGFAPQNPEQQNVNQGQQPIYNQAYNQVPYQQGPVEQPTYDPNFQGQPQYQQPTYQGETVSGGYVPTTQSNGEIPQNVPYNGFTMPQQDSAMPQYSAPEQPMPVYGGVEQGYPAGETQGQQAMPVYQEPVYQEPVYQQPAYQEPVYQQPVYEQPAYQPQEAPNYGEAYNQPVDPTYGNSQTEYNPNGGFVVPGSEGYTPNNAGYQQPQYNGGAPVNMNNAFANGTGVQKDTLGLISMIAGIVSLVCCCSAPINFVPAIAAVVLGILAMRKCKSGKAVAGLVTGGIGILLAIIYLVAGSALTSTLEDTLNDFDYSSGYEEEYDSEYTEDDLEYYYDSDYES